MEEKQQQYTENAQRAIELAALAAADRKHESIGTLHLLIGLVSVDGATAPAMLTMNDVNILSFQSALRSVRVIPVEVEGDYTPRYLKALELASEEAKTSGKEIVGTVHILLALLRIDGSRAKHELEHAGVDYKKASSALQSWAEAIETVLDTTTREDVELPEIDQASQKSQVNKAILNKFKMERGQEGGRIDSDQHVIAGNETPKTSFKETAKRLNLSLTLVGEMWVRDAWLMEQFRIEDLPETSPENVIVSAPTFLWAAITSDSKTKDALEECGFDTLEFGNYSGMIHYIRRGSSDIKGVNIASSVVNAMTHYVGEFQWRSTLDPLAMAFGILSVSGVKYEQFFKGGASGRAQAEVKLRILIEADLAIPVTEANGPTFEEEAIADRLTLSDEMLEFMGLSSEMHDYRLSQAPESVILSAKVTRTTLFAAALRMSPEIGNVMNNAGLNQQKFISQAWLDGFSKSVKTTSVDISIHNPVNWAIKVYVNRFPKRGILDIIGLVYGIIAGGKGGFQTKFTSSGGDLAKAEKMLADLIQADTKSNGTQAAKSHSDRWTVSDQLGYSLYSSVIVDFITHPDTVPPLVVGVSAPWGQGKTSLMRMAQKRLDPEHPQLKQASDEDKESKSERGKSKSELPKVSITLGKVKELLESNESQVDEFIIPLKVENKSRPTVWFNAWKYESSEQIWAGLAHAILSQLTDRLPNNKRELFWLKLQLKRIDPEVIRRHIHGSMIESFIPLITNLFGLFLLGGFLVFGLLYISKVAFLESIIITLGFTSAAKPLLPGIWLLGYALWFGWGLLSSKTKALGKSLDGKFQKWVRQPDYEGRMGFLHLVEEDLRSAFKILNIPGKPVVIFIDDLDRCSPDKIAQVIEAVNLFLAGDYPGCHFVMGLDAEIVAASLEVVHSDIIRKLGDRADELGACFMDKFIQLPVIVPQLSSDQVDNYVNHLLSDTDVSQEQYDIEKENITNLKKVVERQEMSSDATIIEVGKIEVSDNHPELKQELAGIVMSSKSKELKDNDPEMISALQNLKDYLSDNPRTIKRVVNVYRFHRVLSEGWRETKEAYFQSASPKQITRWTIVIVRWPHFVRFIQKHGRKTIGTGSTTYLEKVISLASDANGLVDWGAKLADAGLVKSNGKTGEVDESVSGAGWVDDSDLFRFLKEDSKLSDDNSKLPKATEYGMW